MKTIILPEGAIKVDDEDFERVNQYHWKLQGVFRHMQYNEKILIAYVCINAERKIIRLQRLIMNNPPKDYAVKYRDGDVFNVQKANLYLTRFCKTANRKRRKYKLIAKKAESN